ncbi:host cell division inhibitory peptide Kil [Enterobacter soli]|nr:host cell division inhibitory peptide Kil [Enterobacter soli]
MSPVINHSALKAAQSKAVIARYLGDGRMWQQAHEAIKTAINMPWYRRQA